MVKSQIYMKPKTVTKHAHIFPGDVKSVLFCHTKKKHQIKHIKPYMQNMHTNMSDFQNLHSVHILKSSL